MSIKVLNQWFSHDTHTHVLRYMHCTFCYLFYLHKVHEHRKQKLPSVRIWLCVLNEQQLPLIWAQQKFLSIGRLIVRLSAYLSSSSYHLLFTRLPSILPPSLSPVCPRPHWSAVPWLLPTDQSAWCLLCLGEVNKLLGPSNGTRRARIARAWSLNVRCRRTTGAETNIKKLWGVNCFSAWPENRDEWMEDCTSYKVRVHRTQPLRPGWQHTIYLQSTHTDDKIFK